MRLELLPIKEKSYFRVDFTVKCFAKSIATIYQMVKSTQHRVCMRFTDTTIRTSLHYPVKYRPKPEIVLMQSAIEYYSSNKIVEPFVYRGRFL